MPARNNLTQDELSKLVVESLKNKFVVMPNVSLSKDEARFYFEVTSATLKLDEAINESCDVREITHLINVRNDLLKEWQTKFGFKYPI